MNGLHQNRPGPLKASLAGWKPTLSIRHMEACAEAGPDVGYSCS